MTVSPSHLLILPAYNAGPRLRETVQEALQQWRPALVVDDGSTDDTRSILRELAQHEPHLVVLRLDSNAGKGAAVLAGARYALSRGFTHALVMDADGQHPAASIPAFMAASRARPDALVLGRPVFPPNIPRERLHGRKLSVALVRFELLGSGVADPLFGFRVYPLAPLLAVLGGRAGGRRYDFDTEAAVRLCWAGVPPVNLPAPVLYFSRREGGVTHFRYVRDNLQLAWMHVRLITELLLRRWPAVRRHRRHWFAALTTLVLAGGALPLPAATAAAAPGPVASDPAWTKLAADLAAQPDTLAEFTERRFFPFRRTPLELRGEVRVSPRHGLSLRYTVPEERVVILDAQGAVLREQGRDRIPPAGERGDAVTATLRDILRLDLVSLERNFSVQGRQSGDEWEFRLEPRTVALAQRIGRVQVRGQGPAVAHIELRRSDRQHIEIAIAAVRTVAPFSAEDLRRYFRAAP